MSVKVEQKPIKEVKRVEKIYLKDESCEAKLKAYQELFDVSDFADKIKGER